MRVLIVDDEPDVRLIAQLSLANVGGMDVIEASGGPEAIRLATEHVPEVILLDVSMPGMDGPATLAALRTDPRTAAIPVIFVTAHAMRSEIDELRALGARGVLTKPFDALGLPGLVKQMLDS